MYNCIQLYNMEEGDFLFSIDRHSIKHMSTADYAYQILKKNILTGKLAPEALIVEEQLASELDISRTPLREALQRLEIEELVVRRPNGRLKVAPISIKEVKELFTIRSLLEGIVVSQAAQKRTDEQLKQLRRYMFMFEEAVINGVTEDVLYFGGQFHAYIYEISGNQTAIKILYQLNDHIHRYRRFVPERETPQQNSLDEHQAILKYIEEKDSDQAKEAMEEHIMNSLTIVKNSLEQRSEDE